jgi:hypothetical protein
MSRADARLIEQLAGGTTITKSASLAGVSRRTVTRRLADPDFRRRVNEARRQIVDHAVGRMATSMKSAAVVLRKLLKSDADSIRLGASRAIMELGQRLRDSVEFEERLTTLESLLRERKP